MSKAIKTLAIATTLAAVASVAFAQSPPPYSGGYGAYGPPPPSPVAPYGEANPSYTDYYGTYPAHSWDPDPNLRARLRSEFNLQVDGAPR
jgi:hypothetical protein